MKTATIPSIRVKPELRAEIEAVLSETESLSQFVETAVMEGVQRRRNQAEFVARGMASLASARQTNDYVYASAFIVSLERRLGAVRAKKSTPRSASTKS